MTAILGILIIFCCRADSPSDSPVVDRVLAGLDPSRSILLLAPASPVDPAPETSLDREVAAEEVENSGDDDVSGGDSPAIPGSARASVALSHHPSSIVPVPSAPRSLFPRMRC